MSLFKYIIGVYWKPYKIAKDKATLLHTDTAVLGFGNVNNILAWKVVNFMKYFMMPG